MPTFDFANVIRQIVKAAVGLANSPIAILTVFSATIGVVMGSVASMSLSNLVPSVANFDIDFSSLDSDLFRLCLYVIRADLGVEIFQASLRIFTFVMGFVLSFFPIFLTALWLYKSRQAIAKTVKETTV